MILHYHVEEERCIFAKRNSGFLGNIVGFRNLEKHRSVSVARQKSCDSDNSTTPVPRRHFGALIRAALSLPAGNAAAVRNSLSDISCICRRC